MGGWWIVPTPPKTQAQQLLYPTAFIVVYLFAFSLADLLVFLVGSVTRAIIIIIFNNISSGRVGGGGEKRRVGLWVEAANGVAAAAKCERRKK